MSRAKSSPSGVALPDAEVYLQFVWGPRRVHWGTGRARRGRRVWLQVRVQMRQSEMYGEFTCVASVL